MCIVCAIERYISFSIACKYLAIVKDKIGVDRKVMKKIEKRVHKLFNRDSLDPWVVIHFMITNLEKIIYRENDSDNKLFLNMALAVIPKEKNEIDKKLLKNLNDNLEEFTRDNSSAIYLIYHIHECPSL